MVKGFFLFVLSPQAFGVNSIVLGDNSKAYGDNSKGYGDRIHPYKRFNLEIEKAYAIGLTAIHIHSLPYYWKNL